MATFSPTTLGTPCFGGPFDTVSATTPPRESFAPACGAWARTTSFGFALGARRICSVKPSCVSRAVAAALVSPTTEGTGFVAGAALFSWPRWVSRISRPRPSSTSTRSRSSHGQTARLGGGSSSGGPGGGTGSSGIGAVGSAGPRGGIRDGSVIAPLLVPAGRVYKHRVMESRFETRKKEGQRCRTS